MIQFSKGWLHPDHLFARDGINYAVRYQKSFAGRYQKSYVVRYQKSYAVRYQKSYAGRYPRYTLQTIISCQLTNDKIGGV